MEHVTAVADELLAELAAKADRDFAGRMQRYFPGGVAALGVGNAGVVGVVDAYFRARPGASVGVRLAVAEEVLGRAVRHEEVLLGFAVARKAAKAGPGGGFLERCERWLGAYVSNWAQCDDLCLKVLYPYLLRHLDEVPVTRRWVESPSGWVRRAANVGVVKLVRRQVGRSVFELPLEHVFDNCVRLMRDDDVYVRKGCGWLLRVAGGVHPEEVAGFLREWHGELDRETFRCGLEKLDRETRAELMALG
ncbi:DNA alkylation repair protein [Streptomyces sp. NPDC006997]|uniref:DNA alkylation repair protein n=1 Tax=Streptomyces sp. NPDC006997 TaxID=3155356 RepID=UPI0033DB87B5